MAAPPIVTKVLDYSGFQGVAVDIAQYFEKVAVFIDKNSLVSATKQLTFFLVAPVKALGIDTVQMAHAAREIAVRGLGHQVVMVRQQTVSGAS